MTSFPHSGSDSGPTFVGGRSPAPAVRVTRLMTTEGINLRLKSRLRDDVLLELLELIPELKDAPEARDRLHRALIERELLHSTGIGDGLALPHARNALVGVVERPVVVLGRHPEGIPFGAIDGVPARLFFLLVAPTVTLHLAVLARISRLLRDPRLRPELLRVERPAQALQVLEQAEGKM